jgi:pullulanase
MKQKRSRPFPVEKPACRGGCVSRPLIFDREKRAASKAEDGGRLTQPPLQAGVIFVCAVLLLLAACNYKHAPEPGQQPGPQETHKPVVSATPVPDWMRLPVSKPGNRIIVHYHRNDGEYTGIGLWTFDATQKRSPQQNEFSPAGSDDFGVVFVLDRAQYGAKGDSDKIGLIPRVDKDWKRKDGGDKIWKPELGNEVWIIGGRDEVLSKAPDVSPRISGAFLDTPDRLVIQLSNPVGADDIQPEKITITDREGQVHPVAQTSLLAPSATGGKSSQIIATLSGPLDVSNNAFTVAFAGFKGPAPLTPRGMLDDRSIFYAPDAVLGAAYAPEATTFRLFAPTAKSVNVVLYDGPSGNKGRKIQAMHRAGHGLWEETVPGDLKGKCYVFTLDGPGLSPEREVMDISAINTVNSTRRARITNLAETNPPGWEKTQNGPLADSLTDMIIYEMSVRDFTISPTSGARHRGLYLGFTEAGTHLPNDAAIKTGLDHLVELGVTHVQIMPVQDFNNDETAGAYNWGYNPMIYNSPEGIFATNINDDSRVRELKQLIAALHARGIGVIMDVAYNHTATAAPFNFIVPNYYYRLLPDGSYSNGSGCGNEIRSESPMGGKFVIDSMKYWVREYGVDGFRLDLMALTDLHTMKQAEAELAAINPSVAIYGEAWTGGDSTLADMTTKKSMTGTKLAAFCDDYRNALKGSPRGDDPGFIQDGSQAEKLQAGIEGTWRIWGDGPAQVLNYMTCHDDLVLYDKLKKSMPSATETDFKNAMKLGYLVMYTSQGVPYLHGGEEFARTKGGNENSFESPDAVNQVDWALKRKNYDLFEYTRGLIALRRGHPVFRLRTRNEVESRLKFTGTGDPKTLMFTLDGAGVPGETWKQACVLLNGNGNSAAEFTLPAGDWRVAYDDKGPVAMRSVSGKIKIRPRSGMILFQNGNALSLP